MSTLADLGYWDRHTMFGSALDDDEPDAPITPAVSRGRLVDDDYTVRLPCNGDLVSEHNVAWEDFEGPGDTIIRYRCPNCGEVHRNTRSESTT